MRYVADFGDPLASDAEIAGGKGMNLGRLFRAGFPVPPGYVILTHAYHEFVRRANIRDAMLAYLVGIDHSNHDEVETKASLIRTLLMAADLPKSIADAIGGAYERLGNDEYVAVRSSGTAEDLSEMSFAGQHDTYLDIHGLDPLVEAVRRCWASMWSARAIVYRHHHGIEEAQIGIAVVVQLMVPSEVSGVMFTANPISGAVNEILINSSWGLGESIVSGMVTPDEFVLDHETFELKRVVIGAKAIQVIRNRITGVGTAIEKVAGTQSSELSLSSGELVQLAGLGRDIQAHHEGIPQDIEWGRARDKFYVLQSRDVTGGAFSWDEDLDRFEPNPPERRDTVWTRMWSDMVWPGAVTPLFYSIRAEMLQRMHQSALRMWGFKDAAELRVVKYHRGRVYYNSGVDYANQAKFIPPSLRRMGLLAHMPKEWHKKIVEERWSLTTPLKVLMRIYILDPDHRPWRVYEHLYEVMKNKIPEAEGLTVEQIRALPDDALEPYLQSRIMVQKEFVEDQWTLFILYFPTALALFKLLIAKWYDGANQWIINDLFVGIVNPTSTLLENSQLWDLSNLIRDNAVLTDLFRRHPGRAFFDRVAEIPEGKKFSERYRAFVEEFGHRGHSDRDIYGERRCENPSIDYENFRVLLTTESNDPDATRRSLIARREVATREVIDAIRGKESFSGLKVAVFRLVHKWLMKFWEMRDNERPYVDRITRSKKRAVVEVARRLNERGILSGDDFYFLSKRELFQLLKAGRCDRLTTLKVAARRRNFKRVAGGERGPKYIQNGMYVDLDHDAVAAESGATTLRGIGTSRGEVTGIARLISSQKEIGRVRKGDILVTAATDPGWTPVFLVISGLVLETGGTLAHGACISREYGIPAIQIPEAMSLIQDGATISVNGETGELRILTLSPASTVG